MNKNIYLFSFIILLFCSCKTGSIYGEAQNATKHKVALGTIGTDKDFILQSGFNSAAVPTYKNPIKVSALVTPFTKQTYKTFLKAKVLQSANPNVGYVDSLKVKPKYIQLKIADKVNLIKALNEKSNQSIKDYLTNKTSANIVTNISVAFSSEVLESIQEAESIFLVETKSKTYALQIDKSNAEKQIIHFSEGVVFAYNTANCCWQENKKHQLNIVDFVTDYNSCPNKTYRSSSRAKKKINYFKF